MPHNLIKEKKTALIEHNFIGQGSLGLACNENYAFSLLDNLKYITCGHVEKFVTLSIIFWTLYLLDLLKVV